MEQRVERTLTAVGIFILGKMKHLVPVDTTRLKSSLQYDVDGKKLYFGSGKVNGQSVHYATFMEIGKYKKPYIKPAVFNYARQINSLAQQIFRR